MCSSGGTASAYDIISIFVFVAEPTSHNRNSIKVYRMLSGRLFQRRAIKSYVVVLFDQNTLPDEVATSRPLRPFLSGLAGPNSLPRSCPSLYIKGGDQMTVWCRAALCAAPWLATLQCKTLVPCTTNIPLGTIHNIKTVSVLLGSGCDRSWH